MGIVDSKKTICLINDNFSDLDNRKNIGIYYDQIAKLLSRNGWSVVILPFTLDGENAGDLSETYFKENGIRVYEAIKLYQENTESSEDIWKDNWYLARSHIIDKALQILITKHAYKFDLIEFPEKKASGFIPIRAKYSRIFDSTRIVVKLHGPSQLQRENHMLEGVTFDDLKLDYMERYAFENADIQVSSSKYLLNWARKQGWKMNGNVSVCPNPLTELTRFNSNVLSKDYSKQDRIFYGGRFVKGKGINEFINAMKYTSSLDFTLSKRCKLVFLRTDEKSLISYVRGCLPEFEIDFLNLSQEDQFKLLIEQASLVVIPPIKETSIDELFECMNARIPFFISRDEYVSEVLGVESNLYETLSCDTSKPDVFGSSILRYLNYNREQKMTLLEDAFQRLAHVAAPEQIISWYNGKLIHEETNNKPQKGVTHILPNHEAMVTIIIPYFNAHKYIKNTLEAIYQQTYKNFNIICVNDGSTEIDAIRALEYIRFHYPDITILDKLNGGPGSALNHGLKHVTSKYVVEVDADDIIKADMLETYVKCMEHRPDLAALSCYLQIFSDSDERQVMDCLKLSKEYRSGSYYRPLGPCLPVLFFENCAGCANSIFSNEILKNIGGWPEAKEGLQDWGLWLKLALNGYTVDIVPEVLYYYRNHQVSEIKSKTFFGVDKANYEIIKQYIENNSHLFFSSYFEELHKLIRGANIIKQAEIMNIQLKDSRIIYLENQIYQLDHSLSMQLIKKYRFMVDKVLPVGTHRNNLYQSGLRIVRVILTGGLRGFIRK
jgi:O-antigen biosynthesis protein